MKYQFLDTSNGPVISGEDEVFFFNDFGPIQDYSDADPDFFTKAYDFFEKSIATHSEILIEGIRGEAILSFQTVINKLHMYVGAVEALKGFERSIIATGNSEEHSH